jgi:hypothetical protein
MFEVLASDDGGFELVFRALSVLPWQELQEQALYSNLRDRSEKKGRWGPLCPVWNHRLRRAPVQARPGCKADAV